MKRVLILVVLSLLLFLLIGCGDEYRVSRIKEGLYQTTSDTASTFFDFSREGNVLTVIISQKDSSIAKDTIVSNYYYTDETSAELENRDWVSERFRFSDSAKNSTFMIDGTIYGAEVYYLFSIESGDYVGIRGAMDGGANCYLPSLVLIE